jgi:hypothetical protein
MNQVKTLLCTNIKPRYTNSKDINVDRKMMYVYDKGDDSSLEYAFYFLFRVNRLIIYICILDEVYPFIRVKERLSAAL